MAVTLPGQHLDPFTQAFASQYISLILFILIFSIGAFLPHQDLKASQKRIAVPVIESTSIKSENTEPQIFQSDLNGIFIADTGVLNAEPLIGILTLLSNHDLDARFELYARPGISFGMVRTRAIELHRYLLRIGIPESAIQITSIFERRDVDGAVTILKERRDATP